MGRGTFRLRSRANMAILNDLQRDMAVLRVQLWQIGFKILNPYLSALARNDSHFI